MSKLHIELRNPCVNRSLSVYLLMRENLPWRHLWLYYFRLTQEDYVRFIRFLDAPFDGNIVSSYIHLWYTNSTERDRLFTSFCKIFENGALLKLISSNNPGRYEPWDCSVGTRTRVVGFGFRMLRAGFIGRGWHELSLDISPAARDKCGFCPLLDYPEKLDRLIEKILLQQTTLEEEWTSMKRIIHIQNLLQLDLDLPTVLVGTIMHYLPNVKLSYCSSDTSTKLKRDVHSSV